MLTITAPPNTLSKRAACVTIGNFDGLHLGHRALIQHVCRKAISLDMLSLVVTFWPHPLHVLAGKNAPPLLTSRDARLRLIEALGVDITLEMPFDRAVAALTPQAFVQSVLVPLDCRELVIGYDFSLGKARAGNFAVLHALGKCYGFGVEQLDPVTIGGTVVSSSRMRELLQAGNVLELQQIAGHCHTVSGTVVRGHGRGAGLGFPTANIATGESLLPRIGVYATWCAIDGQVCPSVTNIGVNPTFDPTFDKDTLSVECYCINANIDLYGKQATLHFVQRLRDEQRFASVAELSARIAQDVELARGILGASPMP